MNRNILSPATLLLTLAMGQGWSPQAAEEALLVPPALDVEALPDRTALDDCVERQDDSFAWTVIKSSSSDDMRTFVLDMKPQTWRTKDEVDRTVWQHWVTIAVPQQVKSKTGFMFIDGRGNGGKRPAGPDRRTLEIARATQTVVAEIRMVPNQPLVFHNDGESRTEDDLIAYTWVNQIESERLAPLTR